MSKTNAYGGAAAPEEPEKSGFIQAFEKALDVAVSEEFVNPDGSVTVFHAPGLKLHKTPALNPVLPGFVAQEETFVEPASFIAYLVQFKSSTAICRASLGKNSIVGVLDYHGRAREGSDPAVPGRCAHVATLLCPFDVDYAKWRPMLLGKFMAQEALITFIEDMIHTVAAPAAADLLEMISDMHIERAISFRSAKNDKNGNIRFMYEEVDAERPGGGEVSLPDHVEIVVPIFQGGAPQRLTAKLRHRLDGGKLLLSLTVPGIENKEREAFRAIGEKVREETATAVFYVA